MCAQRQQAIRDAREARNAELREAARAAGVDEDALLDVFWGPWPYPTDESPPDLQGAHAYASDSEEDEDSGHCHWDWLDRPASEAAPGLPADAYYASLGQGDGLLGFRGAG